MLQCCNFAALYLHVIYTVYIIHCGSHLSADIFLLSSPNENQTKPIQTDSQTTTIFFLKFKHGLFMYETKNDVVLFFTSHAEFSEKNYITLMILNKLMLCYGLLLFSFAKILVWSTVIYTKYLILWKKQNLLFFMWNILVLDFKTTLNFHTQR